MVNGEKTKCTYCSNEYSYKGGSTTNLSTHLKRKHIIQYEVTKKWCRENLIADDPDEISENIKQQPTTQLQIQPSTSNMTIPHSLRTIQARMEIYIEIEYLLFLNSNFQ